MPTDVWLSTDSVIAKWLSNFSTKSDRCSKKETAVTLCILKMGYRVGDNAPMAYVELVQKTTDNKPAAEAKEEAKAE